MPTAASVHGAYLSQYTPMPLSGVSAEVRALLSFWSENRRMNRDQFPNQHLSLTIASRYVRNEARVTVRVVE